MIPTSAILRFAPVIAAVILAGLAFWWADGRGYARGVADTNARVAKAAEKIRVQTERTTRALGAAMEERDAALAASSMTIERNGERAASIIIREIKDDPRYHAPECAVSDSVLDAINAARRGAR